MTGPVYDEMADCFEEAAAMIQAYNESAETNQRVTHQGQVIPQVAMMLFQAKLYGPVPEEADGRSFA